MKSSERLSIHQRKKLMLSWNKFVAKFFDNTYFFTVMQFIYENKL